MGKHLITVEVDTDRSAYGTPWSGEHDAAPHKASELDDFASTFGGEPGAQWDHPPYVRTVAITAMDTPPDDGTQEAREVIKAARHLAMATDPDDTRYLSGLVDLAGRLLGPGHDADLLRTEVTQRAYKVPAWVYVEAPTREEAEERALELVDQEPVGLSGDQAVRCQ